MNRNTSNQFWDQQERKRDIYLFLFLLMLSGLMMGFWGAHPERSPQAWFTRVSTPLGNYARIPLSFLEGAYHLPAKIMAQQFDRQQLEAENLKLQMALLEGRREQKELSLKLVTQRHEKTIAFQLLSAHIIGRSREESLHFIIDRGSADGVRENMPVITEVGVVGKIEKVLARASRVLLLADPNSSIAVQVSSASPEPELKLGIVSGRSSLGQMELHLNDIHVKLEPGTPIYSSSVSSIFPGGLLVGIVTETINQGDQYLEEKALVQSAINFGHLQEVMVITNLERTDAFELLEER